MVELRPLYTGYKPKASIKERPEDFVVNEITPSGFVLSPGARYSGKDLGIEGYESGSYSIFVMQKRGWNTIQALGAIAKALGRSNKTAGFAGTKDRRSLSVQLCSIKGVKPEELLGLRIADISINGAWRSESGIKLGELKGNAFEIVARCSGTAEVDSINKANDFLGGLFPNYYGLQRFGARGNNIDIGLAMLKGDFEAAVTRFLTDNANENDADAKEARARFAAEMDFKSALGYFPKHLKYERRILAYLAEYGPNYRGALRSLPRQLLMMFVHSVESDIFNKVVERMVEEGHTAPVHGDLSCRADSYGFPDYSSVSADSASDARFVLANIVGYDTKILSQQEKDILEEYGIGTDDFKLKQMPELRAKGSYRAAFAPYKNFNADCEGSKLILGFSLPAGSYATVLLSEFIDFA